MTLAADLKGGSPLPYLDPECCDGVLAGVNMLFQAYKTSQKPAVLLPGSRIVQKALG